MQEFRVIHTKAVEENWEYIVTAKNADEALKVVSEGKAKCTEHWYEPGTEDNIGIFVVYSSDLQ